MLTGAALGNDALLEPDPDRPQQFHPVGDPAEGALVMAAAQAGLWKPDVERS